MRTAITGASGLVGSALRRHLQDDGHEVISIGRNASGENQISWDPAAGKIDAAALEGVQAVVHLAGENVAQGRWTEEKKRRIRESRVRGTQLISETLASLQQRPEVLVSASAIGYYGDFRQDPVTESSEPGEGFLADVCQAWEAASQPAKDAGIRTVNARIGVVLSKQGGALQAMLTPFKMCAGGIVGSGRQVWSWISLRDVVRAICHVIQTPTLEGPVNLTAPRASTNAEFTKALGHVLGRPTILPMPAFAARLLLGEMADALLLASSTVLPEKLLDSGYEFQHEDLEATLRALLK